MNNYNKEIFVKELGISSTQIESFEDLEKLKRIKIDLDLIISDLDFHIDSCKKKYLEGDSKSDHGHYNRVKRKKRLYGLVSQLIQVRIGYLGKQERYNHRFNTLLLKKIREKIDLGQCIDRKLFDQLKNEIRHENNI
jgi:aminopeptidase C